MRWILLSFAVAARAWLGEGLGQVEGGGFGVECLKHPEFVLTLDGCGLGLDGTFAFEVGSAPEVLCSVVRGLIEWCLKGTVLVAFPSKSPVALPAEREQIPGRMVLAGS